MSIALCRSCGRRLESGESSCECSESNRTKRNPIPSSMISEIGASEIDTIDRESLPIDKKMRLLSAECLQSYGRDPRSGGFCVVMRPRVALSVLIDMNGSDRFRPQRPVVLGSLEADIVGWWDGIPLVVRSSVVDDTVYMIPNERLVPSSQVDRSRAGELRLAYHHARLEELRN